MNNIYLFQVLAGTAFTMVPILFTFCVFLCLRGLPALAHRQAAAGSCSSDSLPLSRMRTAMPVALHSFGSLVHAETKERRVEPMWVPTDPNASRTGDTSHPVCSDAGEALDEPESLRARGARPPWHPLPGMCLALGATGFEIGLETQGPMTGAFILWSPEGKGLFAGPNLEELKHIAEQQAGYREQFLHAPMATPWHRAADD